MSVFQLEVSNEAARSIRKRKLRREEPLFSVGAPVESLYRVATGTVRLITYPDGGKPLVLYRAGPGDTFSEDQLFCESYQYAAIASEDSTIELIDKTLLIRELKEHPPQLFLFLQCVSRRFHQLHANFQRIAIPDAKLRVLDLLKNLSSLKEFEPSIDIRGKVKSYADDLNLSHEAMYRCLLYTSDAADE